MKRDYSAIHEICPKCGKPFLHAKDWGRAGALFVHGYDTDSTSGLRYPIACQVPEKVALDLISMEYWRKQRGRPLSEHPYQTTFGMDSLPGPYRGWTDGERWNGWATPLFEFDEALRIMRDYAGLQIIEGEVHEACYDEERDIFVFHDPAFDEDENEVYAPDTIEMEAGAIKVYRY